MVGFNVAILCGVKLLFLRRDKVKFCWDLSWQFCMI